jgi:hypothetical protein
MMRHQAFACLWPVGTFYIESEKSLFFRALIFKFKHLHYWSRNCLSL